MAVDGIALAFFYALLKIQRVGCLQETSLFRVLLEGLFPMLFNRRSFHTPDLFPTWGSDGFLERNSDSWVQNGNGSVPNAFRGDQKRAMTKGFNQKVKTKLDAGNPGSHDQII